MEEALSRRVDLAVSPDGADDREELLASQTGEGHTQEILVHLVKVQVMWKISTGHSSQGQL